MKTLIAAKSSLLLPVLLVLFTGDLHADRMMWPRQPALSQAHECLTKAVAQVEKSKMNRAAKHLSNAKIQLASASNYLESAEKNKGSNRIVAIKAIEEAQKAIDASGADPTQLDKAQASITKALKEVSDSANAGR